MNPTCECLLRIGARGGVCGKCGLPIPVGTSDLFDNSDAIRQNHEATQRLVEALKQNPPTGFRK